MIPIPLLTPPIPAKTMTWNEQRVEQLIALFKENKTAREIADELGQGITRNAVIGKINRLKLRRLSSDQQPAHTTEAKKSPPPRKTKSSRSRKARITVADLTEKTCKWPIGEPDSRDFRFCGALPCTGLPYCPEHARLAYQASSLRTRMRPEKSQPTE